MTKYIDTFAEDFVNEQEYVDAAFAMIVLFNFGVWLTPTQMPT